jgi:hypothetical protein
VRSPDVFVAIFGCGANTDAPPPELEIVGWPVLDQQALMAAAGRPRSALTFDGGRNYPLVVRVPNPVVDLTNVKLEQT